MKLIKTLRLLSLCPLLLPALSHAQSTYEYLTRDNVPYVASVPNASRLEPGKLYPLVLYMHGSCGECNNHTRITWEPGLQVWHRTPQVEPTFVIAPAQGGRSGWTNAGMRATVLGMVDDFIANRQVDPNRIYVTGFSAGGRATWDYIQHRPDFFAAAIPQAINPPNVNLQTIRSTPIWATIGADDTPARVRGLNDTVAALRAANGDPRGPLAWETGVNPRLTIFEGIGHQAGHVAEGTHELPGYLEWVYAQRRDGNATPNIYFRTPTQTQVIEALPAEINFTLIANDPDGDVLDIEVLLDGEVVSGPWDSSGPGATHPGTITIDSRGEYVLEATATDPGGKSSTTTIYLVTDIVPVPADILSLDIAEESLVLRWSAVSGMDIMIEQSADLSSWEPVHTTVATGEEEATSIEIPNGGSIFVRAVTNP